MHPVTELVQLILLSWIQARDALIGFVVTVGGLLYAGKLIIDQLKTSFKRSR